MNSIPHRPGRYMPGLDGLRAVAVLAVIAYHLNLSWAPGGLLGVTVFFVLSGYLITDILVDQWKRSGHLDLKDFWIRRARRLLPALFTMLIVVMAWVALVEPSQFASLQGDVLAALLYISNWWFIFHHVSYFASFGPPSPLGHLWSLAVEEQFYVIWPLLLILGLRFVKWRKSLAGLILLLALLSALAMAWIYQPGMDPSRVYYGTDTRAFSLLIGAALAMIWPSRLLAKTLPHRSRLSLDIIGVLGLLVILFMIVQTNQYEVFLYRGGLVLVSLATAAVVAALAHPASLLGIVLGWTPLRWLGQRSYALYLWHYPIIILTTPSVETGYMTIVIPVLQITASILLADLSRRFIEIPVLDGRALRLLHKVRFSERGSAHRQGQMILSASLVFVFGVSSAVLVNRTPASTVSTPSSIVMIAPIATPLRDKMPSVIHTHNTKLAKHTATAIGDSIMIDAAPYLEKIVPGIVIDAQVGRQMYHLSDVLDQLKSKHDLGYWVIIELGTNGPFYMDQALSTLRALGPNHHFILVNTRVPRPWQGVVNTTLAQMAAKLPHTTLINWYKASAGKGSYFYPDDVHLNPQGAQFFAHLLAQPIERATRATMTHLRDKS